MARCDREETSRVAMRGPHQIRAHRRNQWLGSLRPTRRCEPVHSRKLRRRVESSRSQAVTQHGPIEPHAQSPRVGLCARRNPTPPNPVWKPKTHLERRAPSRRSLNSRDIEYAPFITAWGVLGTRAFQMDEEEDLASQLGPRTSQCVSFSRVPSPVPSSQVRAGHARAPAFLSIGRPSR